MSNKALPVAGSSPARSPARGSRAITLGRTSVDPDRVISNLYYNVVSLRLEAGAMALQFTASHSGEGTSLVAGQFASFAAGLSSGSVLLIDCSAPNRTDVTLSTRSTSGDVRTDPGLIDAFLEDGRLDRAITSTGATASPDVAVLRRRSRPSPHEEGNALADVLSLARKRYSLIVLDTPSLEDSASTLLFSRACDGVIMVLEAEATTLTSAEATIEAIERSGGKILGLVFNKRRMHMPRWLFRRL